MQKETVLALLTGVIAGLVTTLIIVVIRQFWQKVVSPWFEEQVYKDAHIEGRWYARSDIEGAYRDEVWELKRTGHRVSGTLTCITKVEQGKTYSFDGTFRNLILTGTYVANDTTALDRGSISLMLMANGEKLLGCSSTYYDPEHRIIPSSYECSRQPLEPIEEENA